MNPSHKIPMHKVAGFSGRRNPAANTSPQRTGTVIRKCSVFSKNRHVFFEGFSDDDTVKRVVVDKRQGGCRYGGIKANRQWNYTEFLQGFRDEPLGMIRQLHTFEMPMRGNLPITCRTQQRAWRFKKDLLSVSKHVVPEHIFLRPCDSQRDPNSYKAFHISHKSFPADQQASFQLV